MKSLLLTIALMANIASTACAAEGAPKFIEYQGTVSASDGTPLAPTTPRLYKMEFRLWDQLEGGNLIWSEQQYVTVSNGQFSLRLGEGQPATDSTPPQVAQGELASAFTGKDRFIGITVVTNPASKSEITPRLAFLSAPYALVANATRRVVQQPGTFSTVLAGAISYSTQTSSAASVSLALDKRVNLISADASGTTATLPSGNSLHELVIVKTDATDKYVTVSAPGGGKINSNLTSVRLKVQGESITLQNVGPDQWWIVKDSRDTTPVGTVIAYGGAALPKGYLPCDGTARLRNDHPDLYTAVGNTWGTTTATNFHLPDLRGRFLRGINPGDPGADEDLGLRVAINNSNSGLAVGSYQADQFFKHLHGITDGGHGHSASMSVNGPSIPTQLFNADVEDGKVGLGPSGGNPVTWNMNFTARSEEAFSGVTQTGNMTAPTGGAETRPENAGVRFCIKY